MVASHFRKIIIISGVSLVPFATIAVKNFLFHRKGWSSPEIQFESVLWVARCAVVPLLMVGVIKFWLEINQVFGLIIRLSLGFMLFSSFHIGISFVLCKVLLTTADARNWNLFNTISQHSLQLNLLTYFSTVLLLYAWIYYESAVSATKKYFALEEATKNSPAQPKQDEVENLNFLIKNAGKTTVVSIHSILILQSDGPYVRITTDQGKTHLLQQPLYRVEKRLPPDFIRIHRSSIVNSKGIKEIKSLKNGDYIILLQNDSEIRGSRTYKEILRRTLKA